MTPEELLKKGLKEIGIICSEAQISAFMTLLLNLKKWNRAYSLTALKTDEDIIIKHFLDSLLYLKAIPGNAIKLVDVGTGAGFPGLPIKIARPEMDVTLVEPSKKKSAFLRQMIRLIGLPAINVLQQRVEDLGKEHEKKYDVIVSRATFSIREFLDVACPYVRENGVLVLNKGPKVTEELKGLEHLPHRKDAVKEILKIPLPLSNAERNLVVLSCKM